MFFILELFTKYERVCLTTVRQHRVIWSSKIPYGDRPAVRFTGICAGVTGLAPFAPLLCLWTWHTMPVKWASLGSPEEGNENGSMWLAQPGQSEARYRWRAGERDMHADSMRRGCATPAEDWFSSKFCDLRFRAALSNADISLGWVELSCFCFMSYRRLKAPWSALWLLYVWIQLFFTPCSVTCTHQHISDCEYPLS